MIVINATISNLVIITVTTMVVSNLPRRQGRQKQFSVPVENCFLVPSKGRTGYKSLHKIENTPNFTVTWTCSETFNLHKRLTKQSYPCNLYRHPPTLNHVSTAFRAL